MLNSEIRKYAISMREYFMAIKTISTNDNRNTATYLKYNIEQDNQTQKEKLV